MGVSDGCISRFNGISILYQVWTLQNLRTLIPCLVDLTFVIICHRSNPCAIFTFHPPSKTPPLA